MPVTDDDIRGITESVWVATLGMPVDARAVAFPDEERRLTGCVLITGAWNGAVTVELSETLARRAAAAMFDADPAEVADDEVRDALGELANMTVAT